MSNIDEYDVKILTLLQENGRLTNQELSELVGLSPSQCSRRRISLEQQQLILGYHARLAPKALKQEMQAMVEVKLINHENENAQDFHQFIVNEPSIIDAYKTTGDADYSLKMVVSDLDSLNALLSRVFQTKLISHIKTSLVLERIKESGIKTVN
ncbi:Lrp/AsnC family transcriptional regulator [Psychromonas sp. 14N.309.X.WAT.B.A12]|uniref:Lrp/AsnC family transcriptional regulator n=1 Tax=unclassified Psychromonas TaxID=2614957 RepID=UPI0025AF86B4|nr:Lrp/AsnC family transcriptional regulator [Psychromonas sp. 14N.309.X.WAT.B.A12]MDN2664270.1 Lrp/AsnC family transcriptional regulator [Psychromonas sp. 14N.309.X.WAT.B.A12]